MSVLGGSKFETGLKGQRFGSTIQQKQEICFSRDFKSLRQRFETEISTWTKTCKGLSSLEGEREKTCMGAPKRTLISVQTIWFWAREVSDVW